ncbi:peptidoglycan bridge formation glycyltransferase FemA/FemB family protein [Patescibacteria group bacterium]|nr:peptidoglycan bridge formation glycyltransferase FemA/FemB family protein [Patescibacteria group bacterium]MBU1931107.1 peptidoglycan bridge formation glycyltransferase FemA/FemB family protein [Patescibacteria group bacterium]
MIIRPITLTEKDQFNQVANHPLQSWEWGEFRKQTGLKVRRLGAFDGKQLQAGYQITIHPIPKTNFTIGYFPRGPMPDSTMIKALTSIGQEENCLFIKLEPDVALPINAQANSSAWQNVEDFLIKHNCKPGRPLFTQYTFQIDLTKTEKELLTQMKPKTRYNIRLAANKGVKIVLDSTDQGFKQYLQLRSTTLKRQQFFDHTEDYKWQMWHQLYPAGMAHLLKAVYQNQTLAAWVLFTFKNRLYYPYGASSDQYREVMASNLLMWQAMRFGKKQGCQIFDLWGSLGPDPDPQNPWYGFHRFKMGYGGQLVKFLGSFDLVLKPGLYPFYRTTETIRWQFLRLLAKWKT